MLLLLPSAFRASVPTVVVVVVATGAVALAVVLGARGRAPLARVLRAAHADVRAGLLARTVWPGVAVASTVAVAGHLGTFLVAARAAGVDASPLRLLPVALLVLLAMAVPANVAGWGPREGVAAWAFGVAGLGAAEGVTTAVVYGVLALAVSLPGVVVLAATFVHRAGAPQPARTTREPAAVTAGGAAMTDRPYTLLSCGMSLDGYLDRASERAAAVLQRSRLRPGRRRPGRLRRDPGRRGDRPQRQPAAARPVGATAQRAGGARRRGHAAQGHPHRAR